MSKNTIDNIMTIVNLIQREAVRDNDCNYNYYEYFEIDREIINKIDTKQYLTEIDQDTQKGYLEYKKIDEIVDTINTVRDIATDVISSFGDESPVDHDEWDYNTLVDNIEICLSNSHLDLTYRELAKVIVNTLELHDIINNIIDKAEAIQDAKEELNNTIDNEISLLEDSLI